MEYYKNKTILITGGAGAIGKNIVEYLLPIAKKIIIIDDLSSGRIENVPESNKIVFIPESMLKEGVLDKGFLEKPEIVFHLAANFANQNSIDYPQKDLLVNILGTLNCLEKSKEYKIEKFVYISSSCVYGNFEGVLEEHNHSDSLDTPYAISKLSGEYYTKLFNKLYNLPIVILRYFNAYGEGEMPGKYRNVIPNFFKLAMEKKTLKIFGTGNETRDFTYVKDTVCGTLLAASNENAIGEIINIGQGEETKIIDLANKINKITGNDDNIEFVPQRNWDSIKHRRSSTKKAEKILGFKPKTNLIDGLNKTYVWLKKELK